MQNMQLPGLGADSQRSVSYLHQTRCLDGYKAGYCGYVYGYGQWYSSVFWKELENEAVWSIHSPPVAVKLDRIQRVNIDAHADLWAKFARIRSDKEMVDFADRYGLLQTPVFSNSCAIPLRKNARFELEKNSATTLVRRIWARKNLLNHLSDDELKRRYDSHWYHDIAVCAEPVALWEAYLSEIQPLVKLFNAVTNHEIAYLKKKFRWGLFQGSRDTVTLKYQPNSLEFLVTKGVFDKANRSDSNIDLLDSVFEVGPAQYLATGNDPSLSAKFKERDDFRTPARIFLSERINWYLRNCTKVGLVFNNDFSQQQLRIIPDDLISAIWYQFANVVAAKSEISACIRCNEFYIRHNKRGSEQQYCSNACKTKSYRIRKARKVA